VKPRVRRIFTLKAAAQQVGVAPITLKRWLLDGKVDEVARDRNGWRAFSAADIARIKRYAIALRDPEEE
jgi:predicted site-specific integrase-resolvase